MWNQLLREEWRECARRRRFGGLVGMCEGVAATFGARPRASKHVGAPPSGEPVPYGIGVPVAATQVWRAAQVDFWARWHR